MDGVDIYQSCELAAKLIYSSLLVTPLNKNLNFGNNFYAQEHYAQSFSQYLQSSMYGDQTAHLNAAIISEYHNIINDEDISYSHLPLELEKDETYKQLLSLEIIKPHHNLYEFLFEDFLQFLTEEQLIHNLQVNELTKMNEYIQYKLYGYSKINNDRFGYLKYGELMIKDVNATNTTFEDALLHFKSSIDSNTNSSIINSLAYYNLYLLYRDGQGVQQNQTQAQIYFRKSLINANFPLADIYTVWQMFNDGLKFDFTLPKVPIAILVILSI